MVSVAPIDSRLCPCFLCFGILTVLWRLNHFDGLYIHQPSVVTSHVSQKIFDLHLRIISPTFIAFSYFRFGAFSVEGHACCTLVCCVCVGVGKQVRFHPITQPFLLHLLFYNVVIVFYLAVEISVSAFRLL